MYMSISVVHSQKEDEVSVSIIVNDLGAVKLLRTVMRYRSMNPCLLVGGDQVIVIIVSPSPRATRLATPEFAAE